MSDRARTGDEHPELRDPLRSLGGMHEAGRLRRGVAEFLRIPLVMIAVFACAGLVVAWVDVNVKGGGALRQLAQAMVPGEGAIDFMSAVATSIITVTSITFSVLLLAVQQTASSLTAVVFDQFLRRRANQLYFGFFIGLSTFSFIVLGAARKDPAPAFGGAITMILTVVALVVLVLLIHGSIDQMRPASVVRSIHELALRARERELVLLGRTRGTRRTPENVPERVVTVHDSGYVVSLDTDRLAGVARAAGPDVEVIVEGRLGDYIIYDDVVVRLAGVTPQEDRWDADVRAAFGIDDIRDVDVEAGYATDQLENIAWAASSSAQQSPNTAIAAVRALRDLLARWLAGGERDRSSRAEQPEDLPVVYADGAVPRVLRSIATVTVACAESRQPQTCAELMRAFAGTAPRVRDNDREEFARAVRSVLPSVIQHAQTLALDEALHDLFRVLRECGYDADAVAEVRGSLELATVRLLPKPSDEPEAARPR
ncbi:MAG: DUF2254 domain-containing protein [Actinomycetota bacterium]|nr:DUF2254 domain-containing protein [Actinomycetota bacterium]